MKSFWKATVVIILTATIVGGGTYYYVNSKAKQDKNELQTQINDLTSEVAGLNADSLAAGNAARLLQQTSDWNKYTDKTLNFTLKYPSTFKLGNVSATNQNLKIAVNKISSLDLPLGDDAASATARKATLLDQKFPTTDKLRQSLSDSDAVVKISQILGTYAADSMILGELDATDVELVRQTVFYVDDYEVVISSNFPNAINTIPGQYLKTDQTITGNTTQKIWADQAGFYKAISDNQLSGDLQNWYTDYSNIIATVRLSGDVAP